jgi:transposase-like protein
MRKMGTGPATSSATWQTLEGFARTHVQAFIQQLLEDEVTELLGRAKSVRRPAVDAPIGARNGHGKPRQLALMNGTVTLRRPRVRDLEERFVSRLLPLFQRQTPAVRALLPELYLHGLALGDFELALRGVLGDGAPLSASSLVRLKATWQAQYAAWQQRDLSALQLIYLWADGVYVKAGLEDGKAALLVLIGADAEGRKHVLAVGSGERESVPSWTAVLRDLKARGLRAPKLTIADGHLGIWGAITAIYPTSAEQRCWNHKLRNVLDLIPQKRQAEVKALLQAIVNAETQRAATTGRDTFARTYGRAFPKAVACLARDWERMIAYFAFPVAHWKHLRTTNVIESPFAAVRLRTSAAKRHKKVENATTLIWKTLLVVEQHFRKLNAPDLCTAVYDGVAFRDGIRIVVTPTREQRAA